MKTYFLIICIISLLSVVANAFNEDDDLHESTSLTQRDMLSDIKKKSRQKPALFGNSRYEKNSDYVNNAAKKREIRRPSNDESFNDEKIIMQENNKNKLQDWQ